VGTSDGAAELDAAGGLLTGDRLAAALDGRIFVPNTWTEANLRGAGYDLRLAADLMVVPKEPGSGEHRVYERGEHRNAEVILAPGDNALFSSSERFCLDLDVCGNIGAKFGLAAKGLLILTGLAVDPGYGRVEEAGDWIPVEDQRLHFLVANVGPGHVALRPGLDPIAFLQMYEIPRLSSHRTIASGGFDHLRDQLFRQDAPSGGLSYFRTAVDARRIAEATEREVAALRTDVDRVTNASNYVVVFGVFLVTATLLGVVTSFLVQTLEDLPADLSSARAIWMMVVAGAFVVALTAVAATAIRRTWK
jgi:deoxycytidine triphosphate deaminase